MASRRLGVQEVTTFSLRGLNGQLQFVRLEVWVSGCESVLESLIYSIWGAIWYRPNTIDLSDNAPLRLGNSQRPYDKPLD